MGKLGKINGLSPLIPSRAKRWQLIYYAIWLVPVLVASFANYIVAAESNPGAAWNRYLGIHFFYWMAWGIIGQIVYKYCPNRLRFKQPMMVKFVRHQGLIMLAVLVYFSAYYRLINPSQFLDTDSIATFIKAMYFKSGPILFHLMNIVTYFAVVIVCLIIRQSSYAREQELARKQLELFNQKLETSLSVSKIAALTNQIHPHFFFNAMNNIASMIELDNREGAYHAVTLLAGLLRKTFEFIRKQQIYLDDELDLVRTLLEIGNFRFHDRLNWNIIRPRNSKTLMIPPFVIQPLVENALRHAVERTPKPVEINIKVVALDSMLHVSVSDNGPGADPNNLESHGGVGLQNLMERLELMCAESPEFRIITKPGQGFRVEFELPMETGNAGR